MITSLYTKMLRFKSLAHFIRYRNRWLLDFPYLNAERDDTAFRLRNHNLLKAGQDVQDVVFLHRKAKKSDVFSLKNRCRRTETTARESRRSGVGSGVLIRLSFFREAKATSTLLNRRRNAPGPPRGRIHDRHESPRSGRAAGRGEPRWVRKDNRPPGSR